jgi:hypothetical protein
MKKRWNIHMASWHFEAQIICSHLHDNTSFRISAPCSILFNPLCVFYAKYSFKSNNDIFKHKYISICSSFKLVGYLDSFFESAAFQSPPGDRQSSLQTFVDKYVVKQTTTVLLYFLSALKPSWCSAPRNLHGR